MMLRIAQISEPKALWALYAVFLFLVAAGMALSRLKKREVANPGKAKAGISEKFLVFVLFQAVIYALAWAGGFGFAALLTIFAVLILKEFYLNRKHIYSLSYWTKIRVVFFFTGHLISLYIWWGLQQKMGPGLFLPFVFLMLATGDSYAQITGELAGGPKLAPSISPNKTWSGFFLGGAAVITSGLLFNLAFPIGVHFTHSLILLALIWGGGAAGDLWASSIKRKMGISDFSGIMGASGGMLDRLDSYVFIAPLLAIFIQF